ncbi:cell envelope biogenesis protein OmpA [Cellulophaga baltica]|nr:cell envelope biogenesis protein OmpA [Cellulophaga baltica]
MNFVPDINPFIDIIMKNLFKYPMILIAFITSCNTAILAQNSHKASLTRAEIIEREKREQNYLELKKLGYKEKEIYEDLGNANFLSENYEASVYWYMKLFEMNNDDTISEGYYKRFNYAKQVVSNTVFGNSKDTGDWLAEMKSDYKVKKPSKFKPLDAGNSFSTEDLEAFVANEVKKTSKKMNENTAQIAVTPDGRTAYYTKAVKIKPLYGVFSKKETVHKIFKAEKRAGEWQTVAEVALSPTNSSSMHPAISEDGKRLFFASDMPGSFGKFDIYVADIKRDGSFGVAKNLGKKVNTNEDDLYPNIVGGTSLFFASNGHKGYGGLDVYLAEVAKNKVGWSVNLGSPINSNQDDFSLDIMNEKGVGYVQLNRGKDNGVAEKVSYAYSKSNDNRKDYNSLEALNMDANIKYSTSVFEDK